MDTKDKNRMQAAGKTARRKVPSTGHPPKEAEVQVVYTPAKPFNRNRFLLRLATVAAVVLALVLCISIFFKTRQVMVSGAEKYTPWEIKEASGIQEGDALLSLSETKISARIRTKLPYVGNVRVGIKLPDTVIIEITELQVVYAIEDNNSAWWLLDANGRIVDSTDVAAAKDHTRILGVKIQNAVVGEQAIAAQPDVSTTSDDNRTESEPTTLPVSNISAREQLNAAVQVLTALEQNGVMGNIDTVDVSDVKKLTLWYENRYQVTLGDDSRLDYKIRAMKAAIQKMGEYQSGYLDVSFTIWPNQVHHKPFAESSGLKNKKFFDEI